MADNVNIIVQDTINDIVVNAAVVVETIDINVQAAVDVVDIVANPNNYVVNINRIIGEQVQSDWTQTDNQAPDYIKNKPTIPAAQVNSDWDATSGVAEILNKPAIPTNTSDLVNDGENGVDPFITAADIPPVTGFVPYTGATEDVNLGEFGLLTGNIEFDNTPTNVPTTAGAMYWNDADGTADLILKGGNVKLQIGQESVIRVVNKTATNINLLEANYQAVRVTGAQGQRLKVDLAQATTDNLSAETIGLVTETINNNQEGFITTSGLVRNINTTGSLQGETWADGDILYLSPTTAGNITKVKPTAPNHLVIIGYVVHAHANQGSIFVKVDNGYELDELHNVKITSAANNNVLAYTSATDIWENKTVETALGYTPENVANKSTSTSLGTSNTLYPTQNAVKVYADTKFTLPSLTSGSVLFSNGTTIAQDNAQLFWDDTNNRLGIGTATPAYKLTVAGTIDAGTNLIGNGVWSQGIRALGGTGEFQFLNGGGGFFFTWVRNTIERMRLSSNDNLLINTTTDAGFRLDVNGTARVASDAIINTLKIGRGLNSLSRNLVFGDVAGSAITTGNFNTFIGTNNGGVNTTGYSNVFIGDYAGNANTTGQNNTFVGQFSGGTNIVGNNNTTLGSTAGLTLKSDNNTFIGQSSGRLTSTGSSNTALGGESLRLNTTGIGNVAIGYSSLNSHTNGTYNTALGLNSLFYLTTGSNNLAVGTSSGQLLVAGGNLTSASNSTFLGFSTKSLANGSTNEIVIGYNSDGAGSNTATLGNTSIVDTILRGRINLQQYATGSRPTYVKGALIYDSTLGKLVVGGATGWEVVTSV